MRHKHADLMIARANNKDLEIEYRSTLEGYWLPVKNPLWEEEVHYRIKPMKHKYRVGLFSHGATHLAHTDKEKDSFEQLPLFIRWITDWIEYEV